MGNSKSLNLPLSVPLPCDNENNLIDEATTKAIQNPLILHKIIGNLDFLDLKTSRLVSSTWREIGTEILRKRKCSLVIIKFDLVLESFRQCSQRELYSRPVYNKDITESQNFYHLNKILQQSPPSNFPATHFNFLRGDLGAPVAQNFFEIQGPYIKSLELIKIFHEGTQRSQSDHLCASQILRSVLEQCSQLESLNLKKFPYKLNSPPISLPSLKQFFWSDVTGETVTWILNSAPNLLRTKEANLDLDLQLVRLAGKIGTVEKLNCGACVNTNPNEILLISNAAPKFLHIEFTSDDILLDVQRRRELSTSFSRLLASTRDTLQSLNLHELCFRYESLNVPPFSKLRKLKIGSGHRRPCLPPGINLAETFPNLEILDCSDLKCHSDQFWLDYFPQNSNSPPFYENLSRVTTLEIFDSCNEFFMKKLSAICPNFNKIVVHGNDNLGIILRQIFKLWRHLQKIELHVHPFSSLGQFQNLDWAITGFDPETCDKILAGDFVDDNTEELELVRVAPFICDLKNLKTFKLIFEPHSHYELANGESDGDDPVPLTCVSGQHGFQLMDQLKVIIQFDHNFPGAAAIKSKFKSIEPYVNFEHEHNFRND